MTQVILYTSEDGRSQIQLRADGQTVWLTQMEMAELFSATKQNISLHLKNIFADGELSEDSVVKDSLTTAADGKRYPTRLYNLDAILAVGYRVRSPRGVQFRRWASTVLTEYLRKVSGVNYLGRSLTTILAAFEAKVAGILANRRLADAGQVHHFTPGQVRYDTPQSRREPGRRRGEGRPIGAQRAAH